MRFPIKGLSTAIGLAVLSLSTLRAQVRPLPVIPPDSLVQTYTGRLAHTLLNHYVTQDSLNARLTAYVSQDHLNATLDGYVLHDDLNTALSGYVTTSDSRLSDSRTPKGTAGGSLTGTYPNPAIKSSVNLPGSPTTTTQTASDNSTKVATTAYVKSNLTNYVTTSDARLSDNRIPKGTAGGDLTGTYPNPTIKSSVTLTGNPTVSGNLTTGGTLTVNGTGESLIKGNLRLKGSSAYGNKINLGDGDYVYLHEATDDNLTVKAKNITLAPTTSVTAPTPATTDNSTKVATTAYVKSNLSSYASNSHTHAPSSIGAPKIIAMAKVSSSGTVTNLYGTVTCAKAGTGIYIIRNVTQSNVIIINKHTTGLMAKEILDWDSFQVTFYNSSNTRTDSDFTIMILGL